MVIDGPRKLRGQAFEVTLNLDGKSSGVVHNSFPDPSDRLRRSRGSVAENGQSRLVYSGLAHPINSAHPFFVQLFPLDDHWFDGQVLANLPDEL